MSDSLKKTSISSKEVLWNSSSSTVISTNTIDEDSFQILANGFNSSYFSAEHIIPSHLSLQSKDVVHRTVFDTLTNSFSHISCRTSDALFQFTHYLNEKEEDIAALKIIANWQHRQIDYQSVYTAFLLGALTEEEFEIESEPFVSQFKEIPTFKLAKILKRLDTVLDFKLSPSEYSEYLEVEPNAIEKAEALIAAGIFDDALSLFSGREKNLSEEYNALIR